MCDFDEELPVTGGIDIPDWAFNKDLQWPKWNPQSELEKHLVRLIVLHPDVVCFNVDDLQKMNRKEQMALLRMFNEKLHIKMDADKMFATHEVKQVIVVRTDLKMRRGKEAAQVAHASMLFLLDRIKRNVAFSTAGMEWMNGIFTKVVLAVDSEEALQMIFDKAKEVGLTCYLVTDVGKTEFHGQPTITCLAIGPNDVEKINDITKDLKLR
jgi:PTH2 family peptidyl-tRNA hydrolase